MTKREGKCGVARREGKENGEEGTKGGRKGGTEKKRMAPASNECKKVAFPRVIPRLSFKVIS